MAAQAKQMHGLSTDEIRNISVDMSGLLDDGETLSGIPVITTDESMTVTNEQVNNVPININGASLAVGKAVQFKLSGNAVGRYLVEVKCSTSASQIIEGSITIILTSSTY